MVDITRLRNTFVKIQLTFNYSTSSSIFTILHSRKIGLMNTIINILSYILENITKSPNLIIDPIETSLFSLFINIENELYMYLMIENR